VYIRRAIDEAYGRPIISNMNARTDPCDICVYHRDHLLYRHPQHLIHPEHGKPMVWDIYGEAVCPDCNTRWRSKRDNSVELLAAV
jgi:hypothetical protein